MFSLHLILSQLIAQKEKKPALAEQRHSCLPSGRQLCEALHQWQDKRV
jgi:hypothetical protein